VHRVRHGQGTMRVTDVGDAKLKQQIRASYLAAE
jgi:hypothetical protein